jgi:hypothetical protein
MSKKSHFETLNAKDTDFLVKLLCVRGMVPAKLFEETAKKLFHDVGYNDKIAAGFNDRFVQLVQHTTAYNSIQHSILSATAGPYHNQATRQSDFPTTRTRLG